MITKATIHSMLIRLSLICIFGFLLVACKKEVVEPTPDPDNTLYEKVITVLNFAAEELSDDNPTVERPPIFYSLEENKKAPADYKRTARWDISFGSIYNSFLGANSGSTTNNIGFGGPGKGAIYIVNEKFENVKTVPDNIQFRYRSNAYGPDDSGDMGEGVGWYLYDFTGFIKADGSYDKAHVVYPIEDRTIILITAKGNYAKIKMLSIYKDELDPSAWERFSPHPYFSFKYVIAKPGSNNLDFK